MSSDDPGLRSDTVAEIRSRIAGTADQRTRSRITVASGDWRAAERDETRIAAFTSRVDRKAGHAEASRGTNDFQPASFLPDGATARRAVARTVLEKRDESRTATGFLISPSLFLTNQHVIKTAGEAALTQILFDDELNERGEIRVVTAFALDPDTLFLCSDESKLDYALVAVGPRTRGSGALIDFGYCPLSGTPDRHQLGINANIVQHPEGRKKVVVLRNNIMVARDEGSGRLFYETDTLEGSSGSPVFNDLWDVIALHHYGEASEDVTSAEGGKTRDVNEGIRISSIYADLSAHVAGLTGAGRELLEAALVLWKSSQPVEKKPAPRPRSADEVAHPSFGAVAVADGATEATSATGSARASPTMTANEGPAMTDTTGQTTIVVPLKITIRIGGAVLGTPNPAAVVPSRALATAPRLRAEAKRIDRDYSNRNGFDPNFVPGIKLGLGKLVKPSKSKVAALSSHGEDDSPGELAYENFSVVMDKTHRIALVTATNIDGETYISIDRKTGQAAADQPRPEGDTWYKDTRIDESLTLTNDFYSAWSQYFDRGHLTRRNDPTWGEHAERANADTFHFTNCSPQHWKFNESSTLWQGVERYVLEQGLWETGFDKRLTVLQGPLYDAPQPLYADEVEIPNAFWKIVVWKGKGGLKAVALIVDQSDLLPIRRQGGAPADENARVDVTHFRTTVADVAKRAILNLDELAAFDTAAGELPKVGEARSVLTSLNQIKLV